MAVKKIDPALIKAYQDHRIWKLIRIAQSDLKTEMRFHYPISQRAVPFYQKLAELLSARGFVVTDIPSESVMPSRIGVMHISSLRRGKPL
uniref:Uncharacterized protein n=1 Tax=Serratia phage Kevin TaxID=3161161 RepID=A0AAU8KYW1_9CAUD